MILIVFSIATAMLIQSCINPNCVTGLGSIESDRREIGDFSALELHSDFEVIIKERVIGDNTRLEVDAQSNLLPYIKTTVEAGRLIINTEGCVQPTNPIRIFVKVNELDDILLTSSGEISSKNTLHADKMSLRCEGSGSINVKLKTESLSISHDASGYIKADGRASIASISLSGSGEIDVESLKIGDATATLSGSGEIKVQAEKKLTLTNSGSGNIFYTGDPLEKVEENNGSGSILKK